MPNVSIDIEAQIGDAVTKLALVKGGLDDLSHSGSRTGESLGGTNEASLASRLSTLENDLGSTGGGVKDFNRMMDDATIASHRAGSDIMRYANLIENAGTDSEVATGILARLGGMFGGMGGDISGVAAALAPLAGGFGLLTAAAIVATAAIVALADVIGTLVAIAADLVAPVTLVTGLLGGLGAAFLYVAAQAVKNHVSMAQVHTDLEKLHVAQQTYNDDLKKYGANSTTTEGALLRLHAAQDKVRQDQLSTAIGVGNLSDKFDKLVHNLTVDFTPTLVRAVGGLSQLLTYLNKVSHMNISDAFRSLSTQGVQMIGQFVNAISSVVAHPIRLAFKIAFGTGKGGNEFSSLVSDWWTRFSNFFFGYTAQHQIHIGRFLGPMTTSQVSGVFQPIIDWWDRHDFTKQGHQIGRQILQGLQPAVHPLGQFIVAVLGDAFKTAMNEVTSHFHGWIRELGQYMDHSLRTDIQISATNIKNGLGDAWDWVKTKVSNIAARIPGFISDAAFSAERSIESKIGAAWDWVRNKAQNIWNDIKSFLENPLNIHINFPSLPSWLGGGGDSGGPGPGVGGARGGVRAPRGHLANLAGLADGGGTVHIHIHGGTFTDPASRRREAAATAQEISRRWSQMAGS
jgi:hypothetical protein